MASRPLAAGWRSTRRISVANLLPPLLLGLAVAAWVGGFDLIYACQDIAFDRAHGLLLDSRRASARRARCKSPRWRMAPRWACWRRSAGMLGLAWPFWIGVGVAAWLLMWEHRLVQPGRLYAARCRLLQYERLPRRLGLRLLAVGGAAALTRRGCHRCGARNVVSSTMTDNFTFRRYERTERAMEEQAEVSTLLEQGEALLKEGRVREAAATYARAVQIDPNAVGGHLRDRRGELRARRFRRGGAG